MADRVLPGPVDSSACIREAVCVHTKKIYDSCRDKDCIEDLRVYPTVGSQTYIDNAFSVRPKSAELLYAEVNVEAITFNKGYYTVDVTYFYKITGETFPGANTVTGLAIFDKRVMLCGGEGTVKTFSSDICDCSCVDEGMPTAYVEAVDPIALHLKLVDANCNVCCDNDRHDIPACILARFGEALVTSDTGRRLYVTLGQFSIIRLERDVQLLVPTFDYSVPTKECCDNLGCAEDPCEMFSRIAFPVQQFFPRGCDGSCSQDAPCSCSTGNCSTESGYKTCPTT